MCVVAVSQHYKKTIMALQMEQAVKLASAQKLTTPVVVASTTPAAGVCCPSCPCQATPVVVVEKPAPKILVVYRRIPVVLAPVPAQVVVMVKETAPIQAFHVVEIFNRNMGEIKVQHLVQEGNKKVWEEYPNTLIPGTKMILKVGLGATYSMFRVKTRGVLSGVLRKWFYRTVRFEDHLPSQHYLEV